MIRGIIILAALIAGIATAIVLSIAPLADPETGIPLGLDLRGGVHLVLQAEPHATGEPVTRDDIDNAKAIISNRVNELGVSEPIIQADYVRHRVIVDLAGVDDPDKAVEILRTTAMLTFRDPEGNVVIEGSDLRDARGGSRQMGDGYVVNLSFTAEGTQKFAAATSRLVGQRIGIYLDDQLLTNPTVQNPILNGQAEITGYATLADAAADAVLIRSGALPVSMTIIEKRQVGASLGVDSLNKSVQASIFAIAFIFLFMLILYRLPGVVADLSLVVFALIVLWVFWGFRVVLTLPGIAGFILSIGIAVDFNIIIYERIKEELRTGKSLRASVEAGFSRAFITVIDTHVTVLIAAITLYLFGTGPIKGFALILGIGIVVSLFTAFTFTRFVLRTLVQINPRMNTAWFGVRRSA